MKKKIFAIAATVLAAVLALAAAIPPISAKGLTESPSFGAYKHVFIIGVDRPAQMSARIPPHLFAETKGEARSFYKDPLDGLLSPVMWLVTMVIPG